MQYQGEEEVINAPTSLLILSHFEESLLHMGQDLMEMLAGDFLDILINKERIWLLVIPSLKK